MLDIELKWLNGEAPADVPDNATYFEKMCQKLRNVKMTNVKKKDDKGKEYSVVQRVATATITITVNKKSTE